MFSLDIFSILFLIGCAIAFYLDVKKRKDIQHIYSLGCLLVVAGLIWFAYLIRQSYSDVDLFRAVFLFSMGMVIISSSDILDQLRGRLPILGSCRANHNDDLFSNLLSLFVFVFISIAMISQSLGTSAVLPSSSPTSSTTSSPTSCPTSSGTKSQPVVAEPARKIASKNLNADRHRKMQKRVDKPSRLERKSI